jgi:hypothetical protein
MSAQFMLTRNARRQHETRDDAERAIEIYYPAGFIYYVTTHEVACGHKTFNTYVVKAYDDDGHFLGYCYDAEEAIAAGSC